MNCFPNDSTNPLTNIYQTIWLNGISLRWFYLYLLEIYIDNYMLSKIYFREIMKFTILFEFQSLFYIIQIHNFHTNYFYNFFFIWNNTLQFTSNATSLRSQKIKENYFANYNLQQLHLYTVVGT